MIPELLTRNVIENWPATGEAWLAALPALIDEISSRWKLTVHRPYPMTFHWVTAVTGKNGKSGVLKLGIPDGHLSAEAEALRIFDGDGAVRLVAEDAARGALLMERARPGTPVTSLVEQDDAAATAVLIEAGRRLHRVPPPECTLPHLRDEGADLRGYLHRYAGDGPIPRRLFERAAELFDDLCATAPLDLVLHGDLHHDNVLRDGDRWRAIDPFGRVGDPGYDGGVLLYNPRPDVRDPGLLRLVPARIEQLADGSPMDRVVAWGFVAGVLSEVWTVEAGGAATRALDVARLLEPRLGA